jgi:hypothetical protein
MAIPNSQSFKSFPISPSCFCLIFVKVDIVLVLVDLCKIIGVVVSVLNNGEIGTWEGCTLDFSSDLQNETQGKFLDHTLQLIIPFVHFRNFLSYANSFYSKSFAIILQVLFVILLQKGFEGNSTPFTVFSTTLDLILFGLLGLCLHCAFFYLICSMFQSCLFLCKRV